MNILQIFILPLTYNRRLEMSHMPVIWQKISYCILLMDIFKNRFAGKSGL